ncbi:MAG: NfeD family protein [Vicinamibacterales bacterium]
MTDIRARRPSALQRYILFQLPGLAIAAVAVLALHRWAGVSAWGAAALWLAWLLKDVVLYPKLKAAYEQRDPMPASRFVGRRVVVTQPLAPAGYVRIGSELWSARALDGESIEAGVTVEVVGADGLTLIVRESRKAPGA